MSRLNRTLEADRDGAAGFAFPALGFDAATRAGGAASEAKVGANANIGSSTPASAAGPEALKRLLPFNFHPLSLNIEADRQH